MEERRLCEYLYLATTRCNCRCRHCTPKLYTGGGKTELTSKELIQRYEESYFLQQNFVSVAGGEPFLKEDLEEFILYLDEKKIPCIISTNGWFTDKIDCLTRKLKDAETVRFSVSVDGPKQAHDAIRGLQGVYQRALDSIRLLKERGFGVQVNFVAQEENICHIKTMKELFEEMDVPINIIPKFQTDKEAVVYEEEQIRELYPYMELPREKKLLLSKGSYSIKKNCHAGKNTWLLDSNGDVYTCCGGYYKEQNERFYIGNLREMAFDQLFLSDDARKTFEKSVTACEGCANSRDLEREVAEFGYSTELTTEDLSSWNDMITDRCQMEEICCDNYGWQEMESDALGNYRWMKRKSASVFLKIPQTCLTICISLWNLHETTKNGEKTWLSCEINGVKLGQKICVPGEGTYCFPVSDQNLQSEEIARVTIRTNLSWIPKEAGMGTDTRTLGLAVRSVEIKA